MTREQILERALKDVVTTAHMLFENSVGCAVNHYSFDFEQQGLPGWLRDAETSIVSAKSVLATPSEDGWRFDMENAPRDGTKILLGRFVPGDPYEGRVRVDWWRSHMAAGYIGFAHFNPQGWPATHWRPLPPPPLPDTKG